MTRRVVGIALHVGLRMCILIYVLGPVYWIVNTSFIKETSLINTPQPLFPGPTHATLAHYRFILFHEASAEETVMLQAMYTLSGTFILPALRNSVLIGFFTTVFSLLLAIPAAYTFARRNFKGKEPLFFLFLAVRLLPSISIAVPMFLIFRTIGLLDKLEGLIIVNTAIATPLAIWILRPYFEAITKDYEEAALLDGCTHSQVIVKIILPIARPGVTAAALMVFMMAYSEFIFALTLTSTLKARPASVVVATLAQGLSVSKGMLSAGIVLSFLPPVLLAIAFKRYIFGGITGRIITELR